MNQKNKRTLHHGLEAVIVALHVLSGPFLSSAAEHIAFDRTATQTKPALLYW